MSNTPETINPLDKLTALLGQGVFFVPCEWGTKKPRIQYTTTTLGDTQKPEYRQQFAAKPTGVAIYLGSASGGLCAIDFDHDEDLKVFLEKIRFFPRARKHEGVVEACYGYASTGNTPRVLIRNTSSGEQTGGYR